MSLPRRGPTESGQGQRQDPPTPMDARIAKSLNSRMPPPPLPPALGTTLRMCHKRHLRFSKNPAGKDKIGWVKGKNGGELVDEFFVPPDSKIYQWKGVVYRVMFPNETEQDVMVCRLSKCKVCRGRGEDETADGEKLPFVHLRQLLKSQVTQTPMFISGRMDTIEEAPEGHSDVEVTFHRGGIDGKSAARLTCRICIGRECEDCEAYFSPTEAAAKRVADEHGREVRAARAKAEQEQIEMAQVKAEEARAAKAKAEAELPPREKTREERAAERSARKAREEAMEAETAEGGRMQIDEDEDMQEDVDGEWEDDEGEDEVQIKAE